MKLALRKARKEHRCWHCWDHRPIKKGELYVTETKWQDGWRTFKWHLSCFRDEARRRGWDIDTLMQALGGNASG